MEDWKGVKVTTERDLVEAIEEGVVEVERVVNNHRLRNTTLNP